LQVNSDMLNDSPKIMVK